MFCISINDQYTYPSNNMSKSLNLTMFPMFEKPYWAIYYNEMWQFRLPLLTPPVWDESLSLTTILTNSKACQGC